MSKTYPEPNQVEFFEKYKVLCKKYNCIIQFNEQANKFNFVEYDDSIIKMIEEEIYDKS